MLCYAQQLLNDVRKSVTKTETVLTNQRLKNQFTATHI